MADQAVQDLVTNLSSGLLPIGKVKRGPIVPPFDHVIFGGTGDLAFRKQPPSLSSSFRDGPVERDFRSWHGEVASGR